MMNRDIFDQVIKKLSKFHKLKKLKNLAKLKTFANLSKSKKIDINIKVIKF